MSNIERQMDTYGRGSAGDTPIQSGGGAGEFGGRPGWMDFTPPQQERLYTGRNPFTTPHQGFPDQGEPRRTGYMGPGPHSSGRSFSTMPHEEQHWTYPGMSNDLVDPYTNISHEEYPDWLRDYWHSQGEWEKAQMRMNEPEARALEAEVAADFGNRIRTFTPHMEPGFEPGQGGQYGFPGNWPGTPLALGKEQDWNYTITPGDPFDFTQRSGGLDSLIDNDFRIQDIIDSIKTEPGTGNLIHEGPGRVGEGSYWNVGYTPSGGGSDTFNALMGGANKQQATGGVESVGLYQTWKRIKKQIGEAAANQWLETQQT